MSEKPLAKCQAIKARISETGKGIFITLLVKDKDSLPLEEFHDGLRDLKVGDVFNFYATIDEE